MDVNKLKKLSIKNFIKSSTPSRLQSLRLPRDLNLCGTKTTEKKIYKPNVNAVRNKNKIEKLRNNEKSKSKTIKEQDKIKERFIQSTGVFSEGVGPSLTMQLKPEKKVHWKEAKSSKISDLISSQSTWTTNQTKKNLNEVQPNDLKLDKSDSDSEEKLPFAPSIWDNKFMEVKSETKVWLNKLSSEYTKDLTEPILTMWQLPDSFAYEGTKTSDCSLSELPKGQIGKILVHKSGKFEVSIGNTNYKLDSTLDAFSEDVVCLTSDTKNSYVLGEVKSRFILSPDWNFFL